MLPPYYSYWFRIDNKHMTEPWLVKALMDPANRSAWRNPNKRHNSKLVFPINDNYCCLNSYQLRNEKRGKNLLQIEQWKLKRKLRNLRSTTLGWKNIGFQIFRVSWKNTFSFCDITGATFWPRRFFSFTHKVWEEQMCLVTY